MVPLSAEVWMYQLTDAGLALELTGKGTIYYKNDDLKVEIQLPVSISRAEQSY